MAKFAILWNETFLVIFKTLCNAVFSAAAISSMPKFVESAKRDTWKKTRSKGSKKPILLNV